MLMCLGRFHRNGTLPPFCFREINQDNALFWNRTTPLFQNEAGRKLHEQEKNLRGIYFKIIGIYL